MPRAVAVRAAGVATRLGLLAAALTGTAVALVGALRGHAAPVAPLPLPLVVVALLLLAAELARLHVEVGRSAHTVSLSEVALLVALFTLPPATAVVLRCAVCAAVPVVVGRRSPVRIAFNLANMAFESAVLAVLLVGLTGGAGPLEPRAWAAAVVATQVSALVAGLSVSAAITLHGDQQDVREVVSHLAVGAVVVAATGTLGVVSVVVLAAAPETRWLLGLVYLFALVVYRGYARLRDRQAALESVYALTRRLDGAPDAEVVLHAVLDQVPKLMRAARAEVVLLDPPRRVRREQGGLRSAGLDGLPEAVAQVVETARPLLLPRRSVDPVVRAALTAASARELLLTPLSGDSGVFGVLVVADRLGEVRGFRRDDVLLLETLGLHSAAALAGAQSMARLRHDAEHDALTGLLDRRGFSAALAQAGQQPAGVLLLDLAGFHDVNDVLGHESGDDLLRVVAARLGDEVRAGTPVARLGGDEFAVLLSGVDTADAVEVAERLLSALAEPVDLGSVPVSLESAAGVAAGVAGEQLLRDAEVALHAAKRRGGLRVYGPDLDPGSAQRLQVAVELRRVLADPVTAAALEVHYQPKAELRTGRVVAVEALVRWRRGGTLVPPGEFVPIVESTGLLRPMTLHVLRTALTDVVAWTAAGRRLDVAVNLSPRSLLDERIVDDVRSLLRETGAAPEQLVLEITESAVMDDPARAHAQLADLEALGLRLSVDDFGTGYSSLSYLAQLPVSEVKVDRSFVARMTTDARDAAVVRSVVELAHSLGLAVVAEGVEDDSTWSALVALGCDVAQGFLLSRALPAAELAAWLTARAEVGPPPQRVPVGPS